MYRPLQVLIALLILTCSSPTLRATSEPTLTDVTFTATNDGSAQKYVLRLPAAFDPSAAHDVLIALHGHGADRWQFAKDPLAEGRAARDVATAHQMIFVSPDYRARTSWMGPKAEADVLQIISGLKTNYRVARVFICGASMGGTASLTFAVLHPELISGVASMNGTANFLLYENFTNAISASFGGSRSQIPLEYKKRSAEYWPEKLTMPVGLTTSGRDETVPPDSVQRLARALENTKQKVRHIHRPDAGHNTNYEDAKTILEFMMQHAAPAK